MLDPKPACSTCSEQMAYGRDVLNPRRTEATTFSVSEAIQLDLKCSRLLLSVKKLPFQHFMLC